MAETLDEYLRRLEAEYLRALVARNNFNVRAAAKEAGRSRTSFYRRLAFHGIIRPKRKRAEPVIDLRSFMARPGAH